MRLVRLSLWTGAHDHNHKVVRALQWRQGPGLGGLGRRGKRGSLMEGGVKLACGSGSAAAHASLYSHHMWERAGESSAAAWGDTRCGGGAAAAAAWALRL